MPNWQPLRDLAPEHLDDFMWMFEFELDDGARVQAFKHRWTRRYLCLAEDGRAFVPCDRGRYREGEATRLLGEVLKDD